MKIKDKIERGEFFCAPGIPDMISAVVAKQVGFDAVYASGYWFSASAYGLPDVGITTFTQMVDRVRTLAETMGKDTAVIADADTGYGGLLNVRETVRGYEKAGAQVIQFEDQVFPKKCGHTKNKRIEPIEVMATKIKVALDSRQSEDTLIVARTDAYHGEGLDGVMKRLEAYTKAGANIILPEALQSQDEIREVCRAFDTPVMMNMADGGNTPILDAKTLSGLGVSFAIFPAIASLSAAAAAKHALTKLKNTGTSVHDDVELFDFQEFCRLIGFEDVWEFEKRWQDPE